MVVCGEEARQEILFGTALKSPYQTILVTNTTVNCGDLPHWIHASHTKRVKTADEDVVAQTADSQGKVQVPRGGRTKSSTSRTTESKSIRLDLKNSNCENPMS